MSTVPTAGPDDVAARVERRWATMSVVIVLLLASAAALIGIHNATMPQGRVETVDAARLHLSGEFVEGNLGSAVEPDGSVTVRLIGQQYSFVPDCLLVPADTLVVNGEGTRVITIGPDHKARFQKIQVGRDLGPQIEVLSGLTGNERIVSNPSDSLTEGQPVRLRSTAASSEKS